MANIIKLEESAAAQAQLIAFQDRQVSVTDHTGKVWRTSVASCLKVSQTATGSEGLTNETSGKLKERLGCSKKVADRLIYEAKMWLHSKDTTQKCVDGLVSKGLGLGRLTVDAKGEATMKFVQLPELSKSAAKARVGQGGDPSEDEVLKAMAKMMGVSVDRVIEIRNAEAARQAAEEQKTLDVAPAE